MAKDKSKKKSKSKAPSVEELKAREKAIKAELKRKAREQLDADAKAADGHLSTRERDLAAAAELRDAAKRQAEAMSLGVDPATVEPVDQAALDAELKAKLKAKKDARKLLERQNVDKIDRADEAAVRAYNDLVRDAGLADFITSDAEREAMAARIATDAPDPEPKAKRAKADPDPEPETPPTGRHVAEEVDTEHGREFAVGSGEALATFAKPSESGKAEVAFNGNGQYVITLPDGKKAKGYTRATTYIDGLEYDGALTEWKLRQVLEGAALDTLEADGTALLTKVRDAMHVRETALKKLDKRDRRNELERGERQRAEAAIKKAFKDTVRPIVDELNVIAGTHEKADKGTFIHSLTELHDAEGWLAIKRLRDAGEITDADVDDVRAYANAIEALGAKVVDSEVVVVDDVLQVAGRADRVYLVKLPGMARAVRVIGDVKTGSLYSPGKLAQQLAIYAGSQKYDPATGERSKLGVSQAKGLIVHLPAGSGECHIYVADLALGRKGNKLSGDVRAWRNEGKLGVDLKVDIAAVTS